MDVSEFLESCDHQATIQTIWECWRSLDNWCMNTHNLQLQSTAPTLTDDPRSAANISRRRTLKLAERDELGRLLPGSCLTGAGRQPGMTITTLARQHTSEAIRVLVEIMGDDKAPPAARATAAQALIDRGWGKAPIQIDLNVRQKFDDFLREVGLAANYERDHPDVAEAVEARE
jgi:hypothetical protein